MSSCRVLCVVVYYICGASEAGARGRRSRTWGISSSEILHNKAKALEILILYEPSTHKTYGDLRDAETRN